MGFCSMSGIAAAVDAAVKDAVDILSLSLGSQDQDFYKEPMSIALFGAVRAGVFVACSAGNSGPDASSLSNVAPWITTVGAATMDGSRRASRSERPGSDQAVSLRHHGQPNRLHPAVAQRLHRQGPGAGQDHGQDRRVRWRFGR